MRVGMRVGPSYVSQSTRRRSRSRSSAGRPAPGPTPAQLAAKAEQRAAAQARLDASRGERLARYGPFRTADPRTWHTGHSVLAALLLVVVLALPSMLDDARSRVGSGPRQSSSGSPLAA